MSWADTEQWRQYLAGRRGAAALRREEARKRYISGEGVLSIADGLGVAYSTVMGYTTGLRKPGPAPRFGHGTPARARRHYREGDKPLKCMPCLVAAREQRYRDRNPDGGGKYRLDRSN